MNILIHFKNIGNYSHDKGKNYLKKEIILEIFNTSLYY